MCAPKCRFTSIMFKCVLLLSEPINREKEGERERKREKETAVYSILLWLTCVLNADAAEEEVVVVVVVRERCCSLSIV